MKKPRVIIIKSSPWRKFNLWREHPEYSAILKAVNRYRSKIDFVLVGGSSNSLTSSFCLGDSIVAWDVKTEPGLRGIISYSLDLLAVLLRYRANLIILFGLSQIPVVAFSCLLSKRKFIPIFIGEFKYHGWKTVGLIFHALNLKLIEIVLRAFSITIQKAYALSKYVHNGVQEMAPNLKGIPIISYPISPKFCVSKNVIISSKPIILTVAGIEPRKGIDVLIRAASRIEEDFKVIIKGSVRDPIYMYKLQKMVERHKLQEKVIFDTTLLNYDSLVSYYNSAYLFVFPTREDCLGVVVLEALHCGVPVIATSVGGVPEMIENGVNGVLIKPDDPHALAETISFFLKNKKIRERFAENARARLQRYYVGKITLEEALDKSITQLLNNVK